MLPLAQAKELAFKEKELVSKDYSNYTREKLMTRSTYQGNNAFTAGDYLVALVHYSRAIKLYSRFVSKKQTSIANLHCREPIFFSNRALVYLKLQRYYESITDCTASIDRKPSIKVSTLAM